MTEMAIKRKQEACSILFMSNPDWKTDRIRLWLIWAAKAYPCLKCEQPPYRPCLHVQDVRLGRENPRVLLNPHPIRVDWEKLYSALVERGHIKE